MTQKERQGNVFCKECKQLFIPLNWDNERDKIKIVIYYGSSLWTLINDFCPQCGMRLQKRLQKMKFSKRVIYLLSGAAIGGLARERNREKEIEGHLPYFLKGNARNGRKHVFIYLKICYF